MKGIPVRDVTSEVAKTMATKLTVHAIANVVEQFVQTSLDKGPISLPKSPDVVVCCSKAMRLLCVFSGLLVTASH